MVVRPLRNERLELILYADRQFQRRHVDRISYLETPKDDALIQWYRIVSPNRMELCEGAYLAQFENGVSPCRTHKMGGEWYLSFPNGTRITPLTGHELSILRCSVAAMTIDGQIVEA